MATGEPPAPAAMCDKPPRPKRWIPLSLRMFVAILLTLGAGGGSWIGIPAFRQRRAIKEVERCGGHIGGIWDVRREAAPAWLRRLVGDDLMMAFEEIDEIHFEANSETIDRRIRRLTENGRIGAIDWMSVLRDGPSIDDAAMSCLTGIPSLKKLSFPLCDVGDPGMRHIARLRELEYLGLFGTDVTDAGLAHLKSLHNLKRIDLSATNVTEAGIAELQRALPGLEVCK